MTDLTRGDWVGVVSFRVDRPDEGGPAVESVRALRRTEDGRLEVLLSEDGRVHPDDVEAPGRFSLVGPAGNRRWDDEDGLSDDYEMMLEVWADADAGEWYTRDVLGDTRALGDGE
jgi:hypothetical protein